VTQLGAGRDAMRRFTGRHEKRVVHGAGHNLPQEAPEEFFRAVADVNAWAS
jgi:pimeloyl-ACP methyl ester carboxylesterase